MVGNSQRLNSMLAAILMVASCGGADGGPGLSDGDITSGVVLDGGASSDTEDGAVPGDSSPVLWPLEDCAPACASLAAELGPCWQVACEQPDGACVSAALEEGSPCGADDACHHPGACADGSCEGQSVVDCDDDNPCTTEACDPQEGCSYTSLDVEGCEVPEGCGDGVCDHPSGEWCDTCPDDCGGCSESDCCDPQDTPGCPESDIEACVCEGWDGFCCSVTWDATCVTLAKTVCDAKCGVPGVCGDGVCDYPGGEGCGGCPEDCGDCGANPLCCAPKGDPGCVQSDIEICVCGLDPFCCDEAWDDTCVALIATCGADCEKEEGGCGDGVCKLAEQEDCAGCPADCGACGGWSNCCEAGVDGGCADPVIEACVCETLPTCCEELWTDACAEAAFDSCEAACDDPPAVCGDDLCHEEDETCESCPEDCGICFNAECCETHGSGGCGGGPCEDIVCDIDSYCCDNSWDGDCVACATTGVGYDGLDCTEAVPICQCAEDYCGDDECTEGEHCVNCEEDCGECPPKDCCDPQVSPLCDDQPCQDQVCAIDEFCCETLWDDDCASCAAGGPGPDDADCSELAGACGCHCGDATCDAFEDCALCPDDCGECFCGDGLCNDEEQCDLCVEDCGECVCGDGSCGGNESCESCDADCGVCGADCCVQHDGPGCSSPSCEEAVCDLDPYCCDAVWDGACGSCATTGNGYGDIDCADAVPICQCGGSCGDESCDPLETCSSCPDDCGDCVCGDGNCASTEGCEGCPDDCGDCPPPDPVCGDGACDDGEDPETCPDDCDVPGACVGAEDTAALAAGAPGDVVTECFQECLFSAEGSIPCVQQCIAEGAGLTDGCAACYAEGVKCLFELCPGECLFGNDATEACLSCQEDNGCFAAFDDCSGLTDPPASACGDGTCDDDEGCDGCPDDCGACPAAGCCAPHGATGCDIVGCEALVCAALPACCELAWDESCVACAEGSVVDGGTDCAMAVGPCECVIPI